LRRFRAYGYSLLFGLNDRRLGEDAGDYDTDALNFAEGGNGEEVA
jgi:hypothetical protein